MLMTVLSCDVPGVGDGSVIDSDGVVGVCGSGCAVYSSYGSYVGVVVVTCVGVFIESGVGCGGCVVCNM